MTTTSDSENRYALDFFMDFSHPQLTQTHRQILHDIGKQIYFTTMTDDSDYIPGGMDLSGLRQLPDTLREDALQYIGSRSNYIVRSHIEDYRNPNPRCRETAFATC